MRALISGICVLGALLLTAASMFMNWSFWTGQGADRWASQVLGVVSIGIDAFKASLPLVIAWAWPARLRLEDAGAREDKDDGDRAQAEADAGSDVSASVEAGCGVWRRRSVR
jgi:hypothetical protein